MQFDVYKGFLNGATCHHVKTNFVCTRLVDGKEVTLWIPTQCIQSVSLLEEKQDFVHFTITYTNNETSTCKARDYAYKLITELASQSSQVPFNADEQTSRPNANPELDFIGNIVFVIVFIAIVVLLFKACSFITSPTKDDGNQSSENTVRTWYVKQNALVCDSKDSYEEEIERMQQNISKFAEGCYATTTNLKTLDITHHFLDPQEVLLLDDNDQNSVHAWVGQSDIYHVDSAETTSSTQ